MSRRSIPTPFKPPMGEQEGGIIATLTNLVNKGAKTSESVAIVSRGRCVPMACVGKLKNQLKKTIKLN